MISRVSTLAVIVGLVLGQEYFEERHKERYQSYIKQIPKKFQIHGSDGPLQFQKRFKEIETLAKNENVTILYNVNVEILKTAYRHTFKKSSYKTGKSKRYNVPLKKNSMKLSNFEVLLRKMAEESAYNAQRLDKYSVTTERQKVMQTRQIIMKYKPIISRVKTNYTKIVRPVKKNEVILT